MGASWFSKYKSEINCLMFLCFHMCTKRFIHFLSTIRTYKFVHSQSTDVLETFNVSNCKSIDAKIDETKTQFVDES
jgi:hypothetical protein